ncbi:hypothetical protein [Actinomadura fibrosa]|uniref:Uncharacterized protein n=1 Tax=Actinomadura fibrosa TaxID=111802 RepID=A0ABW2XAY2_9ACTN|nr:hypothetical protein [Actinomadura fibrosa]
MIGVVSVVSFGGAMLTAVVTVVAVERRRPPRYRGRHRGMF